MYETASYPICNVFVLGFFVFKVVMGGGILNFLPASEKDILSNQTGKRLDNRDLVAEWKADKAGQQFRSEVLRTKHDLSGVQNNSEFILGKQSDFVSIVTSSTCFRSVCAWSFNIQT